MTHLLQKILFTAIFTTIGINLSISTLMAGSMEKKNGMLRDLDVIKHTLEVGYGPAEWKRSHSKWDLEQETEEAKTRIASMEKISSKQYQQILKQYLNKTRDYHVGIQFTSTEEATLPFTVKGINGRYFINWVDTKLLAPTHFHIRVGDELLEFDGAPVHEMITQLKTASGLLANAQTDQSLTELSLTHRKGMRGDVVPRGPMSVTVKSEENGKLYRYRLIWNYTPEVIPSILDKTPMQDTIWSMFDQERSTINDETSLMTSLYELYALNGEGGNRPTIGSYSSFIPNLGEKVWEKDEDCHFKAYIYLNPQGKKIGYIRIPNYRGDVEKVETFGQIINYFQENTEALVIDQVHNPGGSVLYMYSLASILADKPFITPKHRICITPKYVLKAHEDLKQLEKISSDADAEKYLDEKCYYRTYEYCLYLKEYCRFIINEWNVGNYFTRPTYLGGVEQINYHHKYRYTKPIVMLIDELDFSGGDFFPAILQDNKRVTLFGTRTAGAGGCVYQFEFPNMNGIAKISYTASIAERVNFQPIEDLGVTPDIDYQITMDDLKVGYKGYVKTLNQVISNLLAEPTQRLEKTGK